MSSSNAHRLPGLQPEPDIQLAVLWQAVRNSFKSLLIIATVVGALTYGVQSLMASRYTSESQIEFVAKRTNPFPEGNERPATPDSSTRLDPAAINTHARALLSSDLLLKVATELQLSSRAEFNSALGPVDTWSGILRLAGIGAAPAGETEEERVLAVVRRQLMVAAIKDTRWIGISFSSTDSKLAADFANALADTYRANLVTYPLDETTKVVEALKPKVDQLRKEVLEAEGEVERYRASSDQFRSGSQAAPITDQRMAGLQDELLRAEGVRNEAEARWHTARELMQSGSAEVLPDVQKSPLVQGLIGQRVRLERQIAESAASLLPGHPRMQQLNADVAGLKRQITAEVQKVVQSIEKDARSGTLRVETVNRQIAALKTKVTGASGNEARLRELESIAKSKRTELERLQKQLEDNRTVVNIRQVPIEAQIVARALPSATPTSPRKGPSTLLAMAAALILGFAFVVTKALVSAPGIAYGAATLAPAGPGSGPGPNGGGGAPIEPAFAPPYIVAAPRSLPRPASVRAEPTPAAARAASAAAPALMELAGRLMTRTDIHAGARTLVTSEAHGFDVMPPAISLAELFSASGKSVVLVVWNLEGRPYALSRMTMKKPGICDLIRGEAAFDEVIGRMPGSRVHLIQPGSPATEPGTVLDPDRLNLTLDALDEAYDHIVVAASADEAQALFEAIEGRFDAAVVAGAEPSLPAAPLDSAVTLLGFEVTGIDVVHVPAGMPKGTGTLKRTA